MSLSLEFLRILLAALNVFFAHFLGRAIGKTTKGRSARRPLFTWTLRFALTLGAICYHGIDRLVIGTLALDAAALAAGWWDEWRPKREEDLTHTMFPDE